MARCLQAGKSKMCKEIMAFSLLQNRIWLGFEIKYCVLVLSAVQASSSYSLREHVLKQSFEMGMFNRQESEFAQPCAVLGGFYICACQIPPPSPLFFLWKSSVEYIHVKSLLNGTDRFHVWKKITWWAVIAPINCYINLLSSFKYAPVGSLGMYTLQ